jgi:hypothetical protein
MSRIRSAVLLVIVAAARVGAQTTDHPFNDLTRYLDADDTVYVVSRTTGEVTGRRATVSGSDITVAGASGPQRLPSADIAWIEKRGDPIWNGALIGASITSLLFTGAAGASCSADCGSDIASGALVGAGIGAGFGALFDWMHPGRTLIYGTRPPSVHAARFEPPVDSIGRLWSRIRPGDEVLVRRPGGSLRGRFVLATDARVTIDAGRRQLEIEAANIDSISRYGSQLGRGVRIGSALGALTAVSALVSGSSAGEVVFAGAIGSVSGLAYGALIGRIVPRHIPAYVAPSRTVRVTPILAPDQRGAMLSIWY